MHADWLLGMDLTTLPGLEEAVCEDLRTIREKGRVCS